MKKPRYKDKAVASVCQVFYRQYMLSYPGIVAKNCFRTQNFIQYRQKLLILTLSRTFSVVKKPSSPAIILTPKITFRTSYPDHPRSPDADGMSVWKNCVQPSASGIVRECPSPR